MILTPKNTNPNETQISEITKLLQLEREDFQKLIDVSESLPVAPVESEAEIIAGRIAELGAETFVLSDEKLQADVAPRKYPRLQRHLL